MSWGGGVGDHYSINKHLIMWLIVRCYLAEGMHFEMAQRNRKQPSREILYPGRLVHKCQYSGFFKFPKYL